MDEEVKEILQSAKALKMKTFSERTDEVESSRCERNSSEMKFSVDNGIMKICKKWWRIVIKI